MEDEQRKKKETFFCNSKVSQDLSENLKGCLKDSSFTDLTVITSEGRFQAHQCVLSASPVLRRLFLGSDQRFLEKTTLNFSSFQHESVQALLEFLYTGEVELTKKTKTCQEFQTLAKHLLIDPPVNKIRKQENLSEDDVSCDKEDKFKKHKPKSSKSKSSKDEDEIPKDKKLSKNTKSPAKKESDSKHKKVVPETIPEAVQPNVREPDDEFLKSQDESLVKEEETPKKRRPSYTPPRLDDYPSNHFEVTAGAAGDLNCDEKLNDTKTTNSDEVKQREEEDTRPGNFSGREDSAKASGSNRKESFDVCVPDADDPSQKTRNKKVAEEDEKESFCCNAEIAETSFNEFGMPDNFDIPVDYIQSQKAELAGLYAQQQQPKQPLFQLPSTSSEFNVQENEVDSTSGQELLPSLQRTVSTTATTTTTTTTTTKSPKSGSVVTSIANDIQTGDKKKLKESLAKPNSKTSSSGTTSQTLMEDLFGTEEDTTAAAATAVAVAAKGPSSAPKKDDEKSGSDISSILKSSSVKPRISTLQNVQDELEAKRKRIMRALKSEAVIDPDEQTSKTGMSELRRKQRRERHLKKKRRRHRRDMEKQPGHECNSNCPGNHVMSEDERWLVEDTDEEDSVWRPSKNKKRRKREEESTTTTSSTSSEESDYKIKEEKLEKPKKNVKRNRSGSKSKNETDVSLTDLESGEEEEEDGVDNSTRKSRRDRLIERREKEGLLWMEKGNGKKVKVTVQNVGEDPIVNLYQYRLQLLKAENPESSESEGEKNLRKLIKDHDHEENLKRVKRKFEPSSSSDMSSNNDEDDESDVEVAKRRKKQHSELKRSQSFSSSSSKNNHGRERRESGTPNKKYGKFDAFKKSLSEKRNIDFKRSKSEYPASASKFKSGGGSGSGSSSQQHHGNSSHREEKKYYSSSSSSSSKNHHHQRGHYDDRQRETEKKKDSFSTHHNSKKLEMARKSLSDLFDNKFRHSYGASTEKPKSSNVRPSTSSSSNPEKEGESKNEKSGGEISSKVQEIMKMNFKKKPPTATNASTLNPENTNVSASVSK